MEIAHLANPAGVRLEMIRQDGSVPAPDAGRDAFGALRAQGAKHVGFLAADIEQTAREFRAKNVDVVHDVTTVGPTGVRNLWVWDHGGNLVEFNQWLAPPFPDPA